MGKKEGSLQKKFPSPFSENHPQHHHTPPHTHPTPQVSLRDHHTIPHTALTREQGHKDNQKLITVPN